MARKPGNDDRQVDFFGAPAPAEPKRPAGPPPRARRPTLEEDQPPRENLGTQLAQASAMELRELAAGLTDESLGLLTVAAIRQLRRRLARDARSGNRRRVPALERAMQELVALFAEQDDDEYDF